MGIVTPDRIIRWLSPQVEVLLGWPTRALVGTSVMALAHPGQAQQAANARRAVEGDGKATGVGLIRAADGGYREIQSTVHAMSYPSGEPAFILGEWRLAQQAASALRGAPVLHRPVGDNAA